MLSIAIEPVKAVESSPRPKTAIETIRTEAFSMSLTKALPESTAKSITESEVVVEKGVMLVAMSKNWVAPSRETLCAERPQSTVTETVKTSLAPMTEAVKASMMSAEAEPPIHQLDGHRADSAL